jgi:hypothetical protein
LQPISKNDNKMDNENNVYDTLFDYLKDLAERTNAGCASVEMYRINGDVIRIEYKPSKKGSK